MDKILKKKTILLDASYEIAFISLEYISKNRTAGLYSNSVTFLFTKQTEKIQNYKVSFTSITTIAILVTYSMILFSIPEFFK